MQKLLLAAIVLTLVSAAWGQKKEDGKPVIYGQVIKEYRYITQDQKDSANKDYYKTTGVRDVAGWEPRIGAKGTYSTDMADFDYKAEFGFNEDTTTIRIRQSYIKAKGALGGLTMGRHWQPGILAVLLMDPMRKTSFQGLGLDLASVESRSSEVQGLGYSGRFFKNGITYETPDLMGFKIYITQDEADGTSIATANHTRWTTTTATYDNDWGKLALKLIGTYAVQDVDGISGASDDSYTNYGFNVKYNDLAVSFIMGEYDNGKTGAVEDVDKKMFAGVEYGLGDITLMASYNKKEEEDNKNEYTQMAVGVGYDFSEKIRGTLAVGQYEADMNDADTPTVDDDNKATIALANLALDF